jgi:antitoxin component of MazEF toxin-antitoxin module
VTEVETDVKKWGNSLGVRLPREALRAAGIHEGDRVRIIVEKSIAPGSLWGMAKGFRRRSGATFEEFKAEERKKERARERRLGLR